MISLGLYFVCVSFGHLTYLLILFVLRNCQSVMDQEKQNRGPLSFAALGLRSAALGDIQLLGSGSKERRKTGES